MEIFANDEFYAFLFTHKEYEIEEEFIVKPVKKPVEPTDGGQDEEEEEEEGNGFPWKLILKIMTTLAAVGGVSLDVTTNLGYFVGSQTWYFLVE